MHRRAHYAAFLVGIGAYAHAGKRSEPSNPVAAPDSIVGSVPGLREALVEQGWQPTPARASPYAVGDLIEIAGDGRIFAEKCFPDATPRLGYQVDATLVQRIKGSGKVRLGIATTSIDGWQERQVTVAKPFTEELDEIDLGAISTVCRDFLSKPGNGGWVIVTATLSAEVQEKLCRTIEGNARVPLGEVGAGSTQTCSSESDGHVPIAFKTRSADLASSSGTPIVPSPAAASVQVDFASLSPLRIDAQLREQECERVAAERGASARAARLEAAARDASAKLHSAWMGLRDELLKCTELDHSLRGRCTEVAEEWVSHAKGLTVSIPAGAEPVDTVCGVMRPAFAGESMPVSAADIGEAEHLLSRLRRPASRETGKAGVEWIQIAGGTFLMGRESTKPDEAPVHTVSLQDFSLSKTEVTVAQYRRCVEAGACTEPWSASRVDKFERHCNWGRKDRDEHPVNCVNHGQAKAFAEWVGGRLPTEAEWEYAARSGGKDWNYPWGNQEATCAYAVMRRKPARDQGEWGCGEKRTWPVCSKVKGNTSHGICDMAGNVSEWVQDRYKRTYDGVPVDGTAWNGDSDFVVIRGGSWVSVAGGLRATNRDYDGGAGWTTGFRVAK